MALLFLFLATLLRGHGSWYAVTHDFFLFLIDDVRLPMPTRFFSATTAALRLPTPFHVTGVFFETRLLGRHFFTPLFLEDPHGFPFSSVHFSLNQRFNAAPFAVFLTAMVIFFRTRAYGIWR